MMNVGLKVVLVVMNSIKHSLRIMINVGLRLVLVVMNYIKHSLRFMMNVGLPGDNVVGSEEMLREMLFLVDNRRVVG